MAATASAAIPSTVRFGGVSKLPDGKWCSMIVSRDGYQYNIGTFETAEAAALAHDRTILAILGPDAAANVLNFRSAFSDTELRFLRGRHAPSRTVAGMVALIRAGTYDAELARFAEHAFDCYTDPELAMDMASFRLAHSAALRQRKEAAAAAAGADPAARAKAELAAEREAFLEAARNKATDRAWVASYCRRRRKTGLTFEDENRWPPVVPTPEIRFGEWIPGEELVYLPNGSSYVDEMLLADDGLTKEEHEHRARMMLALHAFERMGDGC